MAKSISNKSILGALTVNDKNVPVISYSDTTPTSPAVGDLWFNTSNGYTYLYYNDGSSSQWVSISTSGAGAPGVVSATSPLSYNSSTQNISLSTVPVTSGGTGATTASGARTNLDAAQTSHTHAASDITSGSLAMARGGTGVSNGTGLVTVIPSSVNVTAGSASTSSIGQVTFSGTGLIRLNGVFTSEYKTYKIRMVITSGVNDYVSYKYCTSGTATTGAYYAGGMAYIQTTTLGLAYNQQNTTSAQIGYAASAGSFNHWDMDVFNPNNNYVSSTVLSGYGNTKLWGGHGWYSTGNFDGIQFYTNGGGTVSGYITVYGFNN